MDEIKEFSPNEKKAKGVVGIDYSSALWLARNGFVGMKFSDYGTKFWFITDDVKNAKSQRFFVDSVVILNKILKNNQNFFIIRCEYPLEQRKFLVIVKDVLKKLNLSINNVVMIELRHPRKTYNGDSDFSFFDYSRATFYTKRVTKRVLAVKL